MLFNSYFFILIFFPVTFAVYSILNKAKLTIASRVWLACASLFFYTWWSLAFLPLILISIAVNYATGFSLQRYAGKIRVSRRSLLIIGLVFNILLLGYFKYYNFFISNVNAILPVRLPLRDIILPLGISFFTFTQIAYLVDVYKGIAKEYSLLNYILFVTFFPHLIAGPIIHHKEMMPQFDSKRNKLLNRKNVFAGAFLFSAGLFKKLILADTFRIWANYGFNGHPHLTMLEAWAVSLSYTFQLYFDFSGYTDMALGASLFFNIKLPANFNSPYKALDVQDFWRRWHITLSRFFKDYVYIPLGGNRRGLSRSYFNIVITFIIGGIWHGAGWLFILWGSLHGIANIFSRFIKSLGIRLNTFVAWFITFNFINFTWIFFRSKDLGVAKNILSGMFNFSRTGLQVLNTPPLTFRENWFIFGWNQEGSSINFLTFLFIFAGFVITLGFKNSNEITSRVVPSYRWAALTGLLFGVSMLFMTRRSEFLYFQF